MWKILEQTDVSVQFQRNRHSSQAVYWFLRCLFGKDRENYLPVRMFFKLINWHHNRRIRLLEYIEATANLVIGKDMILYGRKREPPPVAVSPNGAAVSAVPSREQ